MTDSVGWGDGGNNFEKINFGLKLGKSG